MAACLILIVALSFSLSGCLMIALKERNIEQRLVDSGAEITHERVTPMTEEGQSGQRIGTILLAYMDVVDRNSETGEDYQHSDMLYVIFAETDASAKWVEDRCYTWKDEQAKLLANGEEYLQDVTHWSVYRHDRVIMIGHFRILAIARTY